MDAPFGVIFYKKENNNGQKISYYFGITICE